MKSHGQSLMAFEGRVADSSYLYGPNFFSDLKERVIRSFGNDFEVRYPRWYKHILSRAMDKAISEADSRGMTAANSMFGYKPYVYPDSRLNLQYAVYKPADVPRAVREAVERSEILAQRRNVGDPRQEYASFDRANQAFEENAPPVTPDSTPLGSEAGGGLRTPPAVRRDNVGAGSARNGGRRATPVVRSARRSVPRPPRVGRGVNAPDVRTVQKQYKDLEKKDAAFTKAALHNGLAIGNMIMSAITDYMRSSTYQPGRAVFN